MAENLEEDFEDAEEFSPVVASGRQRRRMQRLIRRGPGWRDACEEVGAGILDGLLAVFGSDRSQELALEYLSALYSIFKLAKTKGDLALESHVERPDESPLLQKFPSLSGNPNDLEFLCETLRMLTLGTSDPADIRRLMETNLAGRMTTGKIGESQNHRLRAIIESTVAHTLGYAPQVSIEFGRCSLPLAMRPSFQSLEETVTNLPPD